MSLKIEWLWIDFNNFIKHWGALAIKCKIYNMHNLTFKQPKISQQNKQTK